MDLIDATAAALPQSPGLGLTVGLALAAATGLVAARSRGRVGPRPALLLLFLVAAWQPLNQSIEGPVLWTVTSTHGLTTADLLAAPALALLASAARDRLFVVRRRVVRLRTRPVPAH